MYVDRATVQVRKWISIFVNSVEGDRTRILYPTGGLITRN
jgi:hypothetical protein